MSDPRVDRLAHLLVHYCGAVTPGERVWVRGTTLATPLMRALYRETLRAGGLPSLEISLPDHEEISLKMGSDAQIMDISPLQRLAIETYDCMFMIMSEENTRTLAGVDAGRQALAQKAHQLIMATGMARGATGDLKWNASLFPTAAYAQDAEMALSDFEDFVYGACLVDTEDPIAAWTGTAARHQRLIAALGGKHEIRVRAEGTDLRLSIAGRPFLPDDGVKNMPGGEILTGPVEDSVEGTVRFSYPASYGGRSVEDVRLRFEQGRVVECSARSGEEYLRRMLDMDAGARVLGEFAFGTNQQIQRFTRNILFDEKIGGTIHMALGNSYVETGGRNTSALHWDMVCDLRGGSDVWVDDELFAHDGVFVLEMDSTPA